MKRFIPLLALFAAGIVVSIALAAPPPGHGPQTGSSSTSTSTEPGKSGSHAKCHPVNLKGTVTGGTITVNVTKASGPAGKNLVGTAANLTLNGKVSVQAWACGAAASTAPQALQLRQLHVRGSPQTTTTTGP